MCTFVYIHHIPIFCMICLKHLHCIKRKQTRTPLKKKSKTFIVIWNSWCINNNNMEHLLHVNLIWGCRSNKMVQLLLYGTKISIILSSAQLNGILQLTIIIYSWVCIIWWIIHASITYGCTNIIICLIQIQQVKMLSPPKIRYRGISLANSAPIPCLTM